MKILVNSCYREMYIIRMRRSRKPCAARPRKGWRHAVSKFRQKSSQHENSSTKEIEIQHCVGDLRNQDSQLEEES